MICLFVYLFIFQSWILFSKSFIKSENTAVYSLLFRALCLAITWAGAAQNYPLHALISVNTALIALWSFGCCCRMGVCLWPLLLHREDLLLLNRGVGSGPHFETCWVRVGPAYTKEWTEIFTLPLYQSVACPHPWAVLLFLLKKTCRTGRHSEWGDTGDPWHGTAYLWANIN